MSAESLFHLEHCQQRIFEMSNQVINTADAINNVVPESVFALCEEFNAFARKTAEGVLAMALTVYKAKQLKKEDFELFCRLIRFDADSASIRKLVRIGEKHKMLSKHVDALPSAWTTVYGLAGLEEPAFEAAVAGGKVTPTMDGKQLRLISGKTVGGKKAAQASTATTSGSTSSHEYDLVARFPKTLTHDQVLILRSVESLLRNLDASIQLSDKITSMLQEVESMKEAA